jgi:hypothetical protein
MRHLNVVLAMRMRSSFVPKLWSRYDDGMMRLEQQRRHIFQLNTSLAKQVPV